MNHEAIKRVIVEMHEVIQSAEIIERDYEFEEQANYILTGVRRAGKSTLLYQHALDLIKQGIQWNQIIYVNFEDDRLTGFQKEEFDDIIESAHELTEDKPYYFFDEIQIVDGWQHFARRLADHHENVWITGSNAKMLSSEMEQTLGGRYLSRMIMPFSLGEILKYRNIPYKNHRIFSTSVTGRIKGITNEYLLSGGLPEALSYKNKREYIQNVYDKVLLGDMIARNRVMNPNALRLMMKKVAETVMHEISYNRLAGNVRSTGVKCSTDAAITYTGYAEEAYLLFHTSNYVAKFSEREGTPRFYFMDNGFLSLFLVDKNSALLENAVGVHLYRMGKKVYYYHSATTGIDIDFYLPEEKTAVQVTYELNDETKDREQKSLIRLARSQPDNWKYLIVTMEQETVLETDEIEIQVLPLYSFLLNTVFPI